MFGPRDEVMPTPKEEGQEMWAQWEERSHGVAGALELGSGSGGWARAMRLAGHLPVWEVDLQRGQHQDLTRARNSEVILQELRQGLYWVVMIPLPMGSFGKSFRPVLRNRTDPMGRPGLEPQSARRVQLENELLYLYVSLCPGAVRRAQAQS